ncbi:hydroxyethylthiazole kinase [Kalamiella sp. sgz302252]|uniref:hydroxyethylthiazole kinase n=1 Tax=Pantoea sp. sgz302252 TaxID=3341827 RepID=UPI0036D3544D
MIQPTHFTASPAASLALFHQRSPLVHCLTNDVVQSITANVLLALNASPAMVTEPAEASQFAAIADAVLINVGTLTASRSEAMLAAVQSATAAGKSWTLDPVAVGALTFRSDFCQQLLAYRPAAIRGNASEIMALARQAVSGRGVDSLHDSSAALEAAVLLAQSSGAVVAVTGETDYITDGERLLAVSGGSPLMTRVVGTGCALSAVVAGFASLPGDRLLHIAAACRVMSLAGERAAAAAGGPGTFEPLFLDELYQLHKELTA